MNPLFADTSYLLALVNAKDELHLLAVDSTPDIAGRIVTTAWVLTELVDALSRPPTRPLAVELVRKCEADPRVEIVPPSQQLFDAGLVLFARRQDKHWSLTDCISFVAMRQRGLTDALTADHHFQQAGFNVLLK